MVYYRIKPVKKRFKRTKDKTYHYVYEVESYKRKFGKKIKVRQRTKRFIGPYKFLKKIKDNQISSTKLLDMKKEDIMKHIITVNLSNYGFKQTKDNFFENGEICVDLNKKKVFSKNTNSDIYLNVNSAYFGTETLRKLFNFKFKSKDDLMDFVKIVTYSGLLNLSEDPKKNKQIKADEKRNESVNLQGLMNVMGALIEKDKPKKKDPNSANNEAILKILLSKYAGYTALKKKLEQEIGYEESMSFEEFSQKVGW